MKTAEVKAIGNGRLAGYGIVWSGPDDPDLEGDYFTPDTDLWLDLIETGPLLYDHASVPAGIPDDLLPDELKSTAPTRRRVIGQVVKRVPDEWGVWFEAVLDEHEQWRAYVEELARRGVLNFSTDSIPQVVQRVKQANGTHWLKSWCVPMVSVTHHAAEPKTSVHLKSITPLSEIAAYLDTDPEKLEATLNNRAARLDPGKMESKPVENKEPVMALTNDGRLKVVRAALRDQWDNLKALDFSGAVAAYKAADAPENDEQEPDEEVKAEQGGELAARLEPLAAELAGLFGGSVEEALAALMQVGIAMQQAQVGAAEPVSEDVAASMENDEEPGYMVSKSSEKALDRGAVGRALGTYQVKNVNVKKNAAPPAGSLTSFIRGAVFGGPEGDTVRRQQAAVKSSYKALGINPDTAGGYLVPIEQASEIIEMLRARSVLLDMVTTIPLNRDTLNIPKQTGGVTLNWVGENSQISASDPTFGQITLVAKKLSCMVKLSNELLADSDPDVDAFIRKDISRAVATEVDRVILRGAGQANEPRGLLNIADVTSTNSSTPTNYGDLVDIVERVESADVDPAGNWAWVLHPKSKAIIRQVKDSANQYIWTGSDGIGQQVAGAPPADLLGYGWRQTTTTGLDGDSRPRAFFGNWSDVIVGMRKSIEIVASNTAGTAFEYDQTWIRAILRMDVAIRHAESIEILKALRLS